MKILSMPLINFDTFFNKPALVPHQLPNVAAKNKVWFLETLVRKGIGTFRNWGYYKT